MTVKAPPYVIHVRIYPIDTSHNPNHSVLIIYPLSFLDKRNELIKLRKGLINVVHIDIKHCLKLHGYEMWVSLLHGNIKFWGKVVCIHINKIYFGMLCCKCMGEIEWRMTNYK